MSELPVIFSGEMVRALFNGKTQTRRLKGLDFINEYPSTWRYDGVLDSGKHTWSHDVTTISVAIRSPYQVGDHLYVRENWRLARINGASVPSAEFATVQFLANWGVLKYREDWREFYAPLLAKEKRWTESETGDLWGKNRPSIHMPKWAARTWLEVTEVRAQRLQDITEEDAAAEGAPAEPLRVPDLAAAVYGGPRWVTRNFHLAGFRNLWNQINGKCSPWEHNDWVFAYTFRRLQ